jgi:topoisomerase-4 subunit B
MTEAARTPDLFDRRTATRENYTADDIEVLEGLEPVRRRPAMFIGGTDERALHHLVAELLDNAMDEAVAGHANRIELELTENDTVTVRDNGRGIPVDPHTKSPSLSALEVILTRLHSGGKFGSKAYETAGGLHGVGLSVVNALSERLVVEVARDRCLWTQSYCRGQPTTGLTKVGPVANRRGTTVSFSPDRTIFQALGEHPFRPSTLYRMARSKAYLFRGMEIRWRCDEALLAADDPTPPTAVLTFPGGLSDYVATLLAGRETATPSPFAGTADLADGRGRVEWAVTWPLNGEGELSSYCNTVPTPQGGTHEAGLRNALVKGLKAYADLTRTRDADKMAAEDAIGGALVMLSVFLRDPQFQGQTKDRLTSSEATRLVESVVRDHFDHWLAAAPEAAATLLAQVIERAQQRLAARQDRTVRRQTPMRRLRLPGKLTDCSRSGASGTELFIVEGDSAGGSAKQARNRDVQAVLPLRGKILNVASASDEKLRANQELANLVEALGCGTGGGFDASRLRYEKIIIMTDADVDGAHIASLLITFFYRELRPLVTQGHLYLAVPPLYRLSRGAITLYARDDAHRDALLATEFKGRGEVDISRFKGLGEMPAAQLRSTTMDPASRTLLRVCLARSDDAGSGEAVADTERLVDALMGRKPELRLAFILERAPFAVDLDI